MKIYDESLYCQECGCEITIAQSKFCNDYCDDCYEITERQAEQEMQALDQTLEQKTWKACQSEDIDPRNQEEEHLPYCNCPACVGADSLCDGCHKPEEICICGGVPDEF